MVAIAILGCAEVAERRHTEYDPELGWANVPDTRLPDFYGPGRTLTINGQGFRGTRDVEPEVAPGRVRVICSGDSFTLGYGVGDADTWCARLEALDPRYESVNMGQGGYGLGQSYLWYVRDGAALDHQVQIFAFIAADFARMLAPRFQGYGKPVVAWREGSLGVENVPVPDRPPWRRWLLARWDVLSERLGRGTVSGEAVQRRAGAIFEALAQLHAERGTGLLLAYLPMRGEHRGPVEPRLLRFVAAVAEQMGIPFADLGEDLRRLSPVDASPLYLRDGEVEFPGAAGHMSAAGNVWVARRLGARLETLLTPR